LKHLANIISLGRIILVFTLFFSLDHPWLFSGLYLLCGLSDLMDGYIARKTHTQSELGARLDSIADLLFFGFITVSVFLWLNHEVLPFLPWIIIIILIRGVNLAIAGYKYHSFAILHTLGNKTAGLLLFAAPPLYLLLQESAVFWPVCLVAVISAVEECFIHLSSSTLNINRRSFFKS